MQGSNGFFVPNFNSDFKKYFQIRPALKTISAFLVIAFLCQDLLYAGANEGTSPSITLPYNTAVIRKATNSSKELVINIQDAHQKLGAQQSIAHILDTLVSQYDLKLIGVEGASNEVDTSALSSLADETLRKKTGEHLLREGLISAAEFYSIISGDQVGLYGVEDENVYRQNLEVFRKLADQKQNIQRELGLLRSRLRSLEQKVYSPQLKELDAKKMKHQLGEMKFNEYWTYFNSLASRLGIDYELYPDLRKIARTTTLEKTINFPAASAEREMLIRSLTSSLPKDELEKFIYAMLRFKQGKISSGTFYQTLTALAKKSMGDGSSYENVQAYSEYVMLYESIDMVAIFDEAESFENKIRESLFVNEDERLLSELSARAGIISRLLDVTMSSADHEHYRAHPKEYEIENLKSDLTSLGSRHGLEADNDIDFALLQKNMPLAAQFYELASKRNQILLENTLKKMRSQKVRVAALVTGGFHSEGIAKLMDEEKISCLVVMPKFDDKSPDRPYISVLTKKPKEFEKYFKGSDFYLTAEAFFTRAHFSEYSASRLAALVACEDRLTGRNYLTGNAQRRREFIGRCVRAFRQRTRTKPQTAISLKEWRNTLLSVSSVNREGDFYRVSVGSKQFRVPLDSATHDIGSSPVEVISETPSETAQERTSSSVSATSPEVLANFINQFQTRYSLRTALPADLEKQIVSDIDRFERSKRVLLSDEQKRAVHAALLNYFSEREKAQITSKQVNTPKVLAATRLAVATPEKNIPTASETPVIRKPWFAAELALFAIPVFVYGISLFSLTGLAITVSFRFGMILSLLANEWGHLAGALLRGVPLSNVMTRGNISGNVSWKKLFYALMPLHKPVTLMGVKIDAVPSKALSSVQFAGFAGSAVFLLAGVLLLSVAPYLISVPLFVAMTLVFVNSLFFDLAPLIFGWQPFASVLPQIRGFFYCGIWALFGPIDNIFINGAEEGDAHYSKKLRETIYAYVLMLTERGHHGAGISMMVEDKKTGRRSFVLVKLPNSSGENPIGFRRQAGPQLAKSVCDAFEEKVEQLNRQGKEIREIKMLGHVRLSTSKGKQTPQNTQPFDYGKPSKDAVVKIIGGGRVESMSRMQNGRILTLDENDEFSFAANGDLIKAELFHGAPAVSQGDLREFFMKLYGVEMGTNDSETAAYLFYFMITQGMWKKSMVKAFTTKVMSNAQSDMPKDEDYSRWQNIFKRIFESEDMQTELYGKDRSEISSFADIKNEAAKQRFIRMAVEAIEGEAFWKGHARRAGQLHAFVEEAFNSFTQSGPYKAAQEMMQRVSNDSTFGAEALFTTHPDEYTLICRQQPIAIVRNRTQGIGILGSSSTTAKDIMIRHLSTQDDEIDVLRLIPETDDEGLGGEIISLPTNDLDAIKVYSMLYKRELTKADIQSRLESQNNNPYNKALLSQKVEGIHDLTEADAKILPLIAKACADRWKDADSYSRRSFEALYQDLKKLHELIKSGEITNRKAEDFVIISFRESMDTAHYFAKLLKYAFPLLRVKVLQGNEYIEDVNAVMMDEYTISYVLDPVGSTFPLIRSVEDIKRGNERAKHEAPISVSKGADASWEALKKLRQRHAGHVYVQANRVEGDTQAAAGQEYKPDSPFSQRIFSTDFSPAVDGSLAESSAHVLEIEHIVLKLMESFRADFPQEAPLGLTLSGADVEKLNECVVYMLNDRLKFMVGMDFRRGGDPFAIPNAKEYNDIMKLSSHLSPYFLDVAKSLVAGVVHLWTSTMLGVSIISLGIVINSYFGIQYNDAFLFLTLFRSPLAYLALLPYLLIEAARYQWFPYAYVRSLRKSEGREPSERTSPRSLVITDPDWHLTLSNMARDRFGLSGGFTEPFIQNASQERSLDDLASTVRRGSIVFMSVPTEDEQSILVGRKVAASSKMANIVQAIQSFKRVGAHVVAVGNHGHMASLGFDNSASVWDPTAQKHTDRLKFDDERNARILLHYMVDAPVRLISQGVVISWRLPRDVAEYKAFSFLGLFRFGKLFRWSREASQNSAAATTQSPLPAPASEDHQIGPEAIDELRQRAFSAGHLEISDTISTIAEANGYAVTFPQGKSLSFVLTGESQYQAYDGENVVQGLIAVSETVDNNPTLKIKGDLTLYWEGYVPGYDLQLVLQGARLVGSKPGDSSVVLRAFLVKSEDTAPPVNTGSVLDEDEDRPIAVAGGSAFLVKSDALTEVTDQTRPSIELGSVLPAGPSAILVKSEVSGDTNTTAGNGNAYLVRSERESVLFDEPTRTGDRNEAIILKREQPNKVKNTSKKWFLSSAISTVLNIFWQSIIGFIYLITFPVSMFLRSIRNRYVQISVLAAVIVLFGDILKYHKTTKVEPLSLVTKPLPIAPPQKMTVPVVIEQVDPAKKARIEKLERLSEELALKQAELEKAEQTDTNINNDKGSAEHRLETLIKKASKTNKNISANALKDQSVDADKLAVSAQIEQMRSRQAALVDDISSTTKKLESLDLPALENNLNFFKNGLARYVKADGNVDLALGELQNIQWANGKPIYAKQYPVELAASGIAALKEIISAQAESEKKNISFESSIIDQAERSAKAALEYQIQCGLSACPYPQALRANGVFHQINEGWSYNRYVRPDSTAWWPLTDKHLESAKTLREHWAESKDKLTKAGVTYEKGKFWVPVIGSQYRISLEESAMTGIYYPKADQPQLYFVQLGEQTLKKRKEALKARANSIVDVSVLQEAATQSGVLEKQTRQDDEKHRELTAIKLTLETELRSLEAKLNELNESMASLEAKQLQLTQQSQRLSNRSKLETAKIKRAQKKVDAVTEQARKAASLLDTIKADIEDLKHQIEETKEVPAAKKAEPQTQGVLNIQEKEPLKVLFNKALLAENFTQFTKLEEEFLTNLKKLKPTQRKIFSDDVAQLKLFRQWHRSVTRINQAKARAKNAATAGDLTAYRRALGQFYHHLELLRRAEKQLPDSHAFINFDKAANSVVSAGNIFGMRSPASRKLAEKITALASATTGARLIASKLDLLTLVPDGSSVKSFVRQRNGGFRKSLGGSSSRFRVIYVPQRISQARYLSREHRVVAILDSSSFGPDSIPFILSKLAESDARTFSVLYPFVGRLLNNPEKFSRLSRAEQEMLATWIGNKLPQPVVHQTFISEGKLFLQTESQQDTSKLLASALDQAVAHTILASSDDERVSAQTGLQHVSEGIIEHLLPGSNDGDRLTLSDKADALALDMTRMQRSRYALADPSYRQDLSAVTAAVGQAPKTIVTDLGVFLKDGAGVPWSYRMDNLENKAPGLFEHVLWVNDATIRNKQELFERYPQAEVFGNRVIFAPDANSLKAIYEARGSVNIQPEFIVLTQRPGIVSEQKPSADSIKQAIVLALDAESSSTICFMETGARYLLNPEELPAYVIRMPNGNLVFRLPLIAPVDYEIENARAMRSAKTSA